MVGSIDVKCILPGRTETRVLSRNGQGHIPHRIEGMEKRIRAGGRVKLQGLEPEVRLTDGRDVSVHPH